MNSIPTKKNLSASDRCKNIKAYYFARKLPLLDDLNQSGFSTLNFGIGNPDLMPEKRVIKKLCETAQHQNAHGYQSYKGSLALRKAFAAWYSSFFQVKLDPEREILPLLGSKEGIVYTSLTYVNPGDLVLVPNPGYPTYASAAQMAGGEVLYYDLDSESNWQPNWNQLEQLDLSRVKIMWLNYPNMPTGAKATADTFKRAIEFGKKNQILICNDNPYSFVLNDAFQSILTYPGAQDIALELNSLSKSHNLAGWRVGMIAGHQRFLSEILKIKSNVDSGMFFPVQEAAIAALQTDISWYRENNEKYAQRHTAVEKLLAALDSSFSSHQVGMFLWAKIPEVFEGNDEQFSDFLLRDLGLFFTPGSVFGSKGKGYVRISLAVDLEVIAEATKRVQDRKAYILNKVKYHGDQ